MSFENQKALILSNFMKYDYSIYKTFNDSDYNIVKSFYIFQNKIECPICFLIQKIPTRPISCSHIFCLK